MKAIPSSFATCSDVFGWLGATTVRLWQRLLKSMEGEGSWSSLAGGCLEAATDGWVLVAMTCTDSWNMEISKASPAAGSGKSLCCC